MSETQAEQNLPQNIEVENVPNSEQQELASNLIISQDSTSIELSDKIIAETSNVVEEKVTQESSNVPIEGPSFLESVTSFVNEQIEAINSAFVQVDANGNPIPNGMIGQYLFNKYDFYHFYH